jgi:hypothetical protein
MLQNLLPYFAIGIPTISILIAILVSNGSVNRNTSGLRTDMESRFAGVNTRLDKMDGSFDTRFEKVDGRFDTIDKKLDKIQSDLNDFHRSMGQHDKAIEILEKKQA